MQFSTYCFLFFDTECRLRRTGGEKRHRCLSFAAVESIVTLEVEPKPTFVLYAICLITSGAIQNGVPTKVLRLFVVSVSWPATPKSASFISPFSDSRTLAAESNHQAWTKAELGETNRLVRKHDVISLKHNIMI